MCVWWTKGFDSDPALIYMDMDIFLSLTVVATNTDGNGLFWLYSWWGRPEIINHQLLLDLLDWFYLILLPFLSFLFVHYFSDLRIQIVLSVSELFGRHSLMHTLHKILHCIQQAYIVFVPHVILCRLWNEKAFLTVSLRQMPPVFHFAA